MKYKNNNLCLNYENQSGFTLIEMAVVLVIVGILVGSFIGSFSSRIETSRRDATQTQLQEIKAALLGFASANGRLPCPAIATSGGFELPVGGGACARQYGFVPGRTLGLDGAYNRDNLLIDSWQNPIRYSVTIVDTYAFTTPYSPEVPGPPLVPAAGIKGVGMADLSPNLIVCDGYGGTGGAGCGTANVIVLTAPFILLSLGKDGNEFAMAPPGTTAPASAQGQNAGEAIITANAAGENVDYSVGTNRVFVSKSYSSAESSAGMFDDLVLWVSPYVLYAQMIEAGQLP